MKFSQVLSLAAAASAVTADYVCPAQPSMTDAKALTYGCAIQGLLDSYYKSVPVNTTFLSSLPMASAKASNGMTMAENTVTNVDGLAKQAMLGAEALTMMGSMLGLPPPKCTYTFPPAPNATAHLMNAFYLEASLCGAFIGLADYFQSPVLNSLSARLSAEHGIHASALGGMMHPVGFMANSTMLTPAFTPDQILQQGMEVGMLGSLLGGCVMAPAAPCGGKVAFGDLNPTLTGQSSMGMGMGNSTSGGMPAGGSGSGGSATQSAPATFTGAANTLKTGAGAGVTAMALLTAFLMT